MFYTFDMKILFLSTALFGVLGTFATPVLSQEQPSGVAPIFITPYEPQRITRLPTIVHATSNTNPIRGDVRTYTQPGRKSYGTNSLFLKEKNPFAGTGFGRIRAEKDYYDKETKQYYNQYDYMGLLAKRGDTAKLQQVQSYLQQNGVYDPAKVQAAILGATQQKPLQPNTSAPIGTPSARVTATGQTRSFKTKVQTTSVPQRIHGGYDDAENQTLDPAKAIEPTGPRPIFLR